MLATPVIEKLHKHFPASKIDFLLRKGNELLFTGHPFLNKVIVWDKKQNKLINLLKIIKDVRTTKYDLVINIHRFASSGIITFLSGAKEKIGFDKNPLSFCYTKKVKHIIGNGKHEVERNLELLSSFQPYEFIKPRLYPTSADFEKSVSTENNVEIVRVKDLHARVASSYSNALYVIFYVIAMFAVSFHLLHGFQSAFRTLGWVHRKYTPIVYAIGTWFFAVIIPLAFAAMPVYYYLFVC